MESLKALTSLVVAVGFLIGVVMFVYGVYSFKKHSESPQQYTIAMCIGNVLTGAFLLASSLMYSAFKGTMFAESWDESRTGLSMDANVKKGTSDMPDNFLTRSLTPEAKEVIIGFVFFVGLVAFIRGLYLFKDFGERSKGGGSATSMALFHTIGGVMCMNIMMFSCIFATTFNIPYICAK